MGEDGRCREKKRKKKRKKERAKQGKVKKIIEEKIKEGRVNRRKNVRCIQREEWRKKMQEMANTEIKTSDLV